MSPLALHELRAEWTKLWSVRSTAWAALAVVAAVAAVSAFLATMAGTDANTVGAPGDDDVVVNGLRGAWIGQLAMVALGCSAMSSEFSSGTISTTFTAIPNRVVAFAAKTAVVGTVALAAGWTASLLSFLMSQPLLHDRGYVPPAYPIASLTDPTVVRAVAGTALYLTMVAVFALGVAAIVRHAAAAVSVGVGLVLVPTVVMESFAGQTRELLQRVAPTAGLSIQITSERYDTPPFGPWGGLGVTAVWTLAAVLAGACTMARRDV
jgi:hypothetical protein